MAVSAVIQDYRGFLRTDAEGAAGVDLLEARGPKHRATQRPLELRHHLPELDRIGFGNTRIVPLASERDADRYAVGHPRYRTAGVAAAPR